MAEVRKAAIAQRCMEDGCKATPRLGHVLDATSLTRESSSGEFGTKLEHLARVIGALPEAERCLVFVQYDDLLNTVGEALAKAGHRCAVLDGTALKRSTVLEKFQQSTKDSPRVMLLKVCSHQLYGPY